MIGWLLFYFYCFSFSTLCLFRCLRVALLLLYVSMSILCVNPTVHQRVKTVFMAKHSFLYYVIRPGLALTSSSFLLDMEEG